MSDDAPPTPPLAVPAWRTALAAGLALAASALGALILGEYEFQGWMPLVAGPVFGLVVAELALAVARRSWPLAGVVAAAAGAGLLWAGWIDSSEGVEPYPALALVAAGLGAVVAVVRARPV